MNTDINTTLQVLANYCMAAAESMGWTLMRTAHSTFVKETEDMTVQILTPEGQTVASPKTIGATWFTNLDYSGVINQFDYKEGDIYVVSDPYSGYVATHSPDLHMWKPVFYEGELVCFVANHIHNTDVGGAVPGTLSRALREVHQEGLRIPPMRLMREGVLNTDLLNIIKTNVRLPGQNWGDLNAQIASVNVGERKIHEIVARYGKEGFRSGLHQLLDYSENQARAIISSLPDGEYFFSDYADEDELGGYPVRIAVTLKIHGDTMTLDFTGSDPQLATALNMPTGGNERHALAMVGVVYALYCLDPTIVLNAGLVRAVRAILPPGTVVNPVAPAAVGMRTLLCTQAQIVTIGAFARVCPDRMPASPGAACSIMNVKTATTSGRSIMASIGPVGGGSGGGPRSDGADGGGGNASGLKNTPVEVNEAEVPILIKRYGLVPDSGGPGRYRGGVGLEMEFQVFAPQTVVTARNLDRARFSAWGLLGGCAGRSSRFVRNPGTEKCIELGSIDMVQCEPNDIILIQGPGGGGYGKPFDRPSHDVLLDVKRGFISRASAEKDYGVVLSDDYVINETRTQDLREQLANEFVESEFGHGANRLAFERVWTANRYQALTSILSNIPINWRYFVKHQIFAAVGENIAKTTDGVSEIFTAYEDVASRFAGLPKLEDVLAQTIYGVKVASIAN